MTGVAVEQMLELWCVELRQVKAHLKTLFAHPSIATSAAAFLDGLLGPERRKTGWMRAEAAGDPGPWRQQAVLGRSHWDADALCDLGHAFIDRRLYLPKEWTDRPARLAAAHVPVAAAFAPKPRLAVEMISR